MSRRREALADVSGVQLTRYPPGLISALEKLQDDHDRRRTRRRRPPRSSGSSSRIARTEEEGRMSRLNRLFDTHPPLEERIAALQEL